MIYFIYYVTFQKFLCSQRGWIHPWHENTLLFLYDQILSNFLGKCVWNLKYALLIQRILDNARKCPISCTRYSLLVKLSAHWKTTIPNDPIFPKWGSLYPWKGAENDLILSIIWARNILKLSVSKIIIFGIPYNHHKPWLFLPRRTKSKCTKTSLKVALICFSLMKFCRDSCNVRSSGSLKVVMVIRI